MCEFINEKILLDIITMSSNVFDIQLGSWKGFSKQFFTCGAKKGGIGGWVNILASEYH